MNFHGCLLKQRLQAVGKDVILIYGQSNCELLLQSTRMMLDLVHCITRTERLLTVHKDTQDPIYQTHDVRMLQGIGVMQHCNNYLIKSQVIESGIGLKLRISCCY